MSYKMTKRELQHMIYIKKAKTKFNIRKGERGGGEKREEKGIMIIDIHK